MFSERPDDDEEQPEEFALADPDDINDQGCIGVLAARMGDRERALEPLWDYPPFLRFLEPRG